MNAYVKSGLVILASAMVAFASVATQTHDPWTIGIAMVGNIGSTTLALIMQSPLPRKEWTEEERSAKSSPQPPKGPA